MVNLNSKQREKIYPHVVSRQGGEFCVECGKTKNQLKEIGQKPEFCIDNIPNDGDHYDIDKLQLLCHSCNVVKNHPENDVPFHRSSTPEMILGKKYESDFRRWVAGQFMINENIGINYEFLINSGAEKVGCSQISIRRYLDKMTSNEGMYEWDNRFGSTLLVLKDEYKNK